MKQPTTTTDEALRLLFAQALRGDESAYRVFLEQVAKVLRRFLNRADDAEDLVQEVLLTLHKKRDLYCTDMPVLPWVRTIAKHTLIDNRRAQARRPGLVEWSENLEQADRDLESEIDLEALMSCLNERQRFIVTRAKVEAAPHAEIAAELGVTVGSIKVSLHRALALLRKNFYGQAE